MEMALAYMKFESEFDSVTNIALTAVSRPTGNSLIHHHCQREREREREREFFNSANEERKFHRIGRENEAYK